MQIKAPRRSRRQLPVVAFQVKQELQASDLEMVRDLQRLCNCTSTDAFKMLHKDKETETDLSQKRRRSRPRESQGVKAVLGLATFISESEKNPCESKLMELNYQSGNGRKRRASSRVLSTVKKPKRIPTKVTSKPVDSLQIQISQDRVQGYSTCSSEADNLCAQKMYQILLSLDLSTTSHGIPMLVYHSPFQLGKTNSMTGKTDSGGFGLSRAATHVAISRFIQHAQRTFLSDRP